MKEIIGIPQYYHNDPVNPRLNQNQLRACYGDPTQEGFHYDPWPRNTGTLSDFYSFHSRLDNGWGRPPPPTPTSSQVNAMHQTCPPGVGGYYPMYPTGSYPQVNAVQPVPCYPQQTYYYPPQNAPQKAIKGSNVKPKVNRKAIQAPPPQCQAIQASHLPEPEEEEDLLDLRCNMLLTADSLTDPHDSFL